jgi:hypothetical protein
MCHDPHHGDRPYPCPSPLLIVDGKRTSWDEPGDLNPSEILSVDVSKGDSAVVRFGEEARKGVVVITTKQAISRKGLGPRS